MKLFFFFSSRRRHTRLQGDWSSDVCSSDLEFIDSRWFQGIIDTFAQDSKIIAVNPMSPKEASWGYGLSNDNKEIWQPPQGFYPIDDKSGIVPIVNGKPFIYQEQFSEE